MQLVINFAFKELLYRNKEQNNRRRNRARGDVEAQVDPPHPHIEDELNETFQTAEDEQNETTFLTAIMERAVQSVETQTTTEIIETTENETQTTTDIIETTENETQTTTEIIETTENETQTPGSSVTLTFKPTKLEFDA